MNEINPAQLLRTTRLYRNKPAHMNYEQWRRLITVGYVGICGDLFHAGHLNILQTAKMHCRIVVAGVLTDEAIITYKRKPVMPFEERKRIIENMECVDLVVSQCSLSYKDNLLKLKPDFLFHGKDWREGVQKKTREESIAILEGIGGRVVEIDCYEGVSTTQVIAKLAKERL